MISTDPAPSKRSTLVGLIFTVLLFIVCLLGPKLLNATAHLAWGPSIIFFLSRILLWILLLGVFAYARLVEHRPLLLWKAKVDGIRFYVLSILTLLATVVIGGIVINLVIASFYIHRESGAIKLLSTLGLPLKLLAIFTAGVVEEVIFRGYLMPRLQLYTHNSAVSITTSAVLFGFAHFGYGTMANILVPVFVGLVFGWHYNKYKNIKVLIICHVLIDFYAIVLTH